jgi:hypothetical protein
MGSSDTTHKEDYASSAGSHVAEQDSGQLQSSKEARVKLATHFFITKINPGQLQS